MQDPDLDNRDGSSPTLLPTRCVSTPVFSWMDTGVCLAWFNKVFLPTIKLFTHKPVALIIDNFSGHIDISPDPQVTLYWLPPNATAIAQPLDQGILVTIKKNYQVTMAQILVSFVDRWIETRATARTMVLGCQGLDQLIRHTSWMPQ